MPKDNRILLVEDTPSLAQVYLSFLSKAGLEVDHVDTLRTANEAVSAGGFDIILLDLQLPDGDGTELLERVVGEERPCAVIVITSNGSINTAVAAMRLGAYDFIVKPIAAERLITTVKNARERLEMKGALDVAKRSLGRDSFHGFIGSSLEMQAVYRMVESVARSTATVFITGESGTGKEVCAEAIHRCSARRDKPFVALNCGAIPRDLLESEVFGHLKGSFTGAISDKKGAAAIADGGTLFLDEICEMDLALQTKLLRFLQSSTITPVGTSKPTKVDVRIICATNRDPLDEVREGRFREDLYYRLHVVPITMPPLRERAADILDIASAFLKQFADEDGKEIESFSPEVEDALQRYRWPGNVRELQNLVRQLVVMNEGPVLTASMLPKHLSAPVPLSVSPTPAATPLPDAPAQAEPVDPAQAGLAALIGRPLAVIEREIIEATIATCNGSVPKAARMLDVSPSTIYRKREAWADA